MATKENYDFCYGSGRLASDNSHEETKPHHLGGMIQKNFDHLSLRHFGQHSLNLNLEHNKIQNLHQ
jgi:hypothetical protein